MAFFNTSRKRLYVWGLKWQTHVSLSLRWIVCYQYYTCLIFLSRIWKATGFLTEHMTMNKSNTIFLKSIQVLNSWYARIIRVFSFSTAFCLSLFRYSFVGLDAFDSSPSFTHNALHHNLFVTFNSRLLRRRWIRWHWNMPDTMMTVCNPFPHMARTALNQILDTREKYAQGGYRPWLWLGGHLGRLYSSLLETASTIASEPRLCARYHLRPRSSWRQPKQRKTLHLAFSLHSVCRCAACMLFYNST